MFVVTCDTYLDTASQKSQLIDSGAPLPEHEVITIVMVTRVQQQ